MPFRTNMFHDQIAQPGTTRGEIDLVMLNKGIIGFDVGTADLFTNGDDEFKFGGTLFIHGQADEYDDETGEPTDEIAETTMEFDGFDSLEAARAWLKDELECSSIVEVD
jgi:hypothetical protein